MRETILIVLALAGCAAPDVVIAPSGGHRALQFLEPIRVPGLFSELDISAGTTLVADRTLGGTPLYCGMVLMRDILLAEAVPVCASYANRSISFATDRGVLVRVSLQPTPLPPGTVREFRLR